MARAMRPVFILMLLATVLFVVDGLLDHAYANQPILEEYKGVGWTSFVFAFANLLMALAVARGSERTLIGRIALSGFFILERPITAFVLGDKPVTSIAIHFATAIVELIILVGAVRVWRLGHSVVPADLDAMFALDAASPRPDATFPAEDVAVPTPVVAGRDTGGSAWLIGILTLLLAAVLVADGAVAGFLPGGREWGVTGESAGWLVYLFAVVALTVATRAVHGNTIALRLLLALALILFVERAFSPFVVKVTDPVQLGLHGVAAFIALALALATASALRGGAAHPTDASPRASAAT